MADQDTPSKRRRRDHSPELKRELVRQCLLPGASVSSIAMAHGINANLVFKWRREHCAAEAADAGPAQASAPLLLPIAKVPAVAWPPDQGRLQKLQRSAIFHLEVYFALTWCLGLGLSRAAGWRGRQRGGCSR